VLDTARQLARLPSLLGPVDPLLEKRLMRRVRMGASQPRGLPWLRPGWAIAGLATVLLAVMLLTPAGQTAMASFMAVFSLGRTEVRITPVDTPAALSAAAAAETPAVQERLTLDQAQTRVPFSIPQPAYLPAGYGLRGVDSYSYPHLPAWMPQPFFVELVYKDGRGEQIKLRIYPIMLGDEASISGLNLQAAPIHGVQDVDVSGQPGVLLQLGGDQSEAAWQEVVWEQDDLILALSAADLAESELLRIAQSVQ
jgi:hypothetical protein